MLDTNIISDLVKNPQGRAKSFHVHFSTHPALDEPIGKCVDIYTRQASLNEESE
jgi:hypothetical protein